MVPDAATAVTVSRVELDQLYATSPAGSLPDAFGRGTALIATGSKLGRVLAFAARPIWRGKHFDRSHARLQNVLTPARVAAFSAEVFEAPSRLDGRPCLVLDYSASFTARFIRDEIREVSPGEFLGIVFVAGRRVPVDFWLHFDDASTPTRLRQPFDFALQERSGAWIDEAPIHLERVLHLDASPERVFAVLADYGNWSNWFRGMRRVRVDGPGPGIGALRTVWVGASRVQERFSRWDDEQRLTFSLVRSSVPGLRSMVEDWALDAEGQGTRLTIRIGVEPAWALRRVPRLVRSVIASSTKGAAQLERFLS